MSFSVENYFEGLQSGDVIFSYKGDISSGVINHILDSVERMSNQSDDSSRIRKRVYNVLVESLQNLYHHVDKLPDDYQGERVERFGLIVVSRNNSGYTITSGNFILNSKVTALGNKIDRINNSTADDIKELYEAFRDAILNLADDIELEPKLDYIAFKKGSNIVDICVQRKGLKLWINLRKGKLDDPKNLMRDVSLIGHWGNGDYEIVVANTDNLEYISSLIKQAL